MGKPVVTGDLMANYVEEIATINNRVLRAIADHIAAGYVDPVRYQAALGEVAMMILEQQQPLRDATEIIVANNGKKQRYNSKQ